MYQIYVNINISLIISTILKREDIMPKIMALDLGDQWVGIALSDTSLIFAKPNTTVNINDIEEFLSNFIEKENIKEIVIGYPKTLRGTESEQTLKVLNWKSQFENKFPEIKFVLWDERLSSKRAAALKPARTRDEKLKSHAIAAAFILDSYLSFLSSRI